MPKSNFYEAGILNLLLNGTAIPGIAAIDSTVNTLYVALHTSSPGGTGDQTVNEISYTGYQRVAVTRSSTSPGWVISGGAPASASPVANITFGMMTGGTGGTVTYFSIGASASGTGAIYYYGAVEPTINVVNGLAPQLSTATTITEL